MLRFSWSARERIARVPAPCVADPDRAPERAELTDDEEQEPRYKRHRKLAGYLKYSAAGMQLFVALGLGTLLGWWLDGQFGLSPLFLVCGMFLGFATGFYTLYKELFGRKR